MLHGPAIPPAEETTAEQIVVLDFVDYELDGDELAVINETFYGEYVTPLRNELVYFGGTGGSREFAVSQARTRLTEISDEAVMQAIEQAIERSNSLMVVSSDVDDELGSIIWRSGVQTHAVARFGTSEPRCYDWPKIIDNFGFACVISPIGFDSSRETAALFVACNACPGGFGYLQILRKLDGYWQRTDDSFLLAAAP